MTASWERVDRCRLFDDFGARMASYLALRLLSSLYKRGSVHRIFRKQIFTVVVVAIDALSPLICGVVGANALVDFVGLRLGRAASLLRLGLLARACESDLFLVDFGAWVRHSLCRDPLCITACFAFGWLDSRRFLIPNLSQVFRVPDR